MDKDRIASMFSLEGKTALIAGASRGIGEEIARVYALVGAKLIISSRRPEGINEAAERLRKDTGAKILAVPANISYPDDRKKLVGEAMAWDKIFEVNLKGPYVLSKMVFLAWMKEHGGCIINTSSIAAYGTGGNIEGAYSITKSALTHLTKILASEWGKYRVRVNAIAPGLIKTRLSQALWDRPGIQESAQTKAVPRLGVAEDLAGAALLLASKAGELINGQDLIVDNGALVTR